MEYETECRATYRNMSSEFELLTLQRQDVVTQGLSRDGQEPASARLLRASNTA